MSVFAVPGVGTMTSSALDERAVSIVWQNLLLKMLGITPSGPNDEDAYKLVRIDWPTDGQPDWTIDEDIAFIAATCEPDDYDEIQNQTNAPDPDNDEASLQTSIYTRVWRVRFVFYGPKAVDRARQVKTCCFQDFAHDTLALSNLYLQYPLGSPRRNPELFTNRWWNRVDFAVMLNEQITETLAIPSIASVQIVIEDADGVVSDQTVTF